MKLVIRAGIILFCVIAAYGDTIVPGTSNPWLAGMPAGSVAGGVDLAPDQSPVLVSGVPLAPGLELFFQVGGFVSNGPCCALIGPDGGVTTWADFAPQNGIANIQAPINSLLGVFLDDDQPSSTAAPANLDFSTLASRNYLSLAPELKQVFFIGDGLTGAAVQQRIVVPVGATRLFLGTADGFEWNNNRDKFTVNVTAVPEPGSAILFVSVVALLGWLRRAFLIREPVSVRDKV